MKKIFSLLIGLFLLVSIKAQMQIDKEFVYKKIDKQTHEVYVYEGPHLVEQGVIKNGKREGVWKSYNYEGDLIVEASFAAGKKNGVWVIYNDSELKYVLHYQDNVRVEANNLLVSK